MITSGSSTPSRPCSVVAKPTLSEQIVASARLLTPYQYGLLYRLARDKAAGAGVKTPLSLAPKEKEYERLHFRLKKLPAADRRRLLDLVHRTLEKPDA